MWTLAEVLDGKLSGAIPGPDLSRLETVAHWCQSYLLRGHPELGRPGPVCPWCPPSVARGHFYINHLAAELRDEGAFITGLLRMMDEYARMPPDSGPDLPLKTVVNVVSFIGGEPDPENLRQWMTRVHRAAKQEFVNRGLMLGEFFPDHLATGIRSDAFKPLRSPFPMFVIRAMVSMDIAFLSERKEYADAYFAKFGEQSRRQIREVLSISPERLARSRSRSLLRCLCWYGLEAAAVDGIDFVTGALTGDQGHLKLQEALDQDRTYRPLVTAITFQPAGLGKALKPGSLEHLDWLWRTAHVLRGSAGMGGFSFRDGDRLVAVLHAANPAEASRVDGLVRSAKILDGLPRTVSGRATEGVRCSYGDEWEWDGSDWTSASALLESARSNLSRYESGFTVAEPDSASRVATRVLTYEGRQ